MAEEENEKTEAEGKPAAEAAGEGEDSLEPPKSSKKKFILIAAVAVLLIGGGAGAYLSGAFGGKAPEGTEEAGQAAGGHEAARAHGAKSKEGEKSGEESKPTFFSLGTILVNLNSDPKHPNFLKMKVSLELADEKDIPSLEALKPRIIDNFQVYLRELRIEDLRGSAGLYRLREELLLRVTEAVQPIRVKDVLFQEMLVQ